MWKRLELLVKFCLLVMVLHRVQADDDEDVGMTLEEMIDAMEAFTESCDPQPEREHVKQLLLNDENPDYESKCLRRCLMEQFDLISEGESQMNVEKTVEIMSMMFSDSDSDTLNGIIEQCNTENGGIAEKCENAHAHGMCTLKGLKEKGFKIPEIKE